MTQFTDIYVLSGLIELIKYIRDLSKQLAPTTPVWESLKHFCVAHFIFQRILHNGSWIQVHFMILKSLISIKSLFNIVNFMYADALALTLDRASAYIILAEVRDICIGLQSIF